MSPDPTPAPVPSASQRPPDPPERGVVLQALTCFGCLGLILGVLGLMALGVRSNDQATRTEPAQVEQTLQAIVPCQLPSGYRGFRALERGGRKVATITPHTHSGLEVPLTGRLTLSLWTFAPGSSREAQREELEGYWLEKLRDYARKTSKRPQVTLPEPERGTLALEVRGQPLEARTLRYTLGEGETSEEVLLLFARLPRQAGGSEEIALSAAASPRHFDRAALDAFLASVR